MNGTVERTTARVGLVLGGGGVLGAAWLMGGLGALTREAGWDPCSADLVVGTSAGALVGALAAGGTRPWLLHESGSELDFEDVMTAANYRLELPLRPLPPGSWTMVVEGWRGGGDAALGKILAGLLPRGLISTRQIEAMVARRVPEWPLHSRLWVVAVDYESGARHVFSRAGGEAVSVGEAVAASCAIPGFYSPVRIGGRRFVDGGLSSAANLDLVAEEQLDLVICMLPLSPADALARRTPFARFRRALQRRLLDQIRELEQAGTAVLHIEPEAVPQT
jgi:NTE family protein